MRVLVAENDPLVREWLGRQATDLGIEMIFACSSEEAMGAITLQPPDCVVLDAASSSESAAPLWSQLRQNPALQHIPVLLYSSSSRWSRVAELAGAEMDGFIPRPFTTASLLDAAQRAAWRRSPAPGTASA